MFISTGNIEVRRHNGQNEYGDWLPASHEDVPEWVAEMIADELAWHDDNVPEGGKVSQAGSIWTWRKA